MSEKIKPALTADEWRAALAHPYGISDYVVRPAEELGHGDPGPGEFAEVIALCNAALPDDDPRKITREKLKDLVIHVAGSPCDDEGAMAFLSALESYLPPASVATDISQAQLPQPK